MKGIQVFSKIKENMIENSLQDIVHLHEDSVVIISTDHEDVEEVTRTTLDATIVLKSVEQIIIKNFFHPNNNHSLVFRDEKNQMMWVQFTDPQNDLLYEGSYSALESYDAVRLVRKLSLKGIIIKFQPVVL